jgi:KDO2-lipid IV(A) lauroyltransferase
VARRSGIRALRDHLVYGGLVALATVGRAVPLSIGRRLGSGIGRLAWHVVRRERNRALRNVAIAFPALSDREREAIVRSMLRHLGQSLFEIAWIGNLSEETLPRTTSFEGLEHMQAALAPGKGAVLFTGHCGNWEWLAAAIALSGFRMNTIARDIEDDRLNRFIVGVRAAHGVGSIGRGSENSARALLQTLRGGAILGALIDQSIRAESVDLNFFGRPASTPIGPARIAIRSGAAAITGFIERRGSMQHVRFEPPIFPSRHDDPAALTAQITGRIEEQIRRVPEQWVWMHDRWRQRTG